jgi:hypothetical protein
LIDLAWSSPEEGAKNTIYLASSPEVAEINGKYFIKNEPAEPSLVARDPQIARKLWELIEEMVSL